MHTLWVAVVRLRTTVREGPGSSVAPFRGERGMQPGRLHHNKPDSTACQDYPPGQGERWKTRTRGYCPTSRRSRSAQLSTFSTRSRGT